MNPIDLTEVAAIRGVGTAVQFTDGDNTYQVAIVGRSDAMSAAFKKLLPNHILDPTLVYRVILVKDQE